MADPDKLQLIANRVVDQYWKSGLDGLEARDQVFYLVWCYAGELNNGGHGAFFYNCEADNYRETLDALHTIGLDSFANLLTRAAAALFDGSVPRDQEERNEIIDKLPDDPAIEDELEYVDDRFFGDGGGDWALYVLARWYLGDTGSGESE